MPTRKLHSFAKYLREKRVAAGLSQKEVSDHLGYKSAQFVSNWERGLADPPVETLRRIALLYKVPLKEMHELILEVTIEKVTREMKTQFFGRKK